jgi:hypothetical protein
MKGLVAPGGMAQTRHLAKKLRAEMPQAKIVVGRWGLANEFNEIEDQRKLLFAAGADEVTTTLTETRNVIMNLTGKGKPSEPDGDEGNRAVGKETGKTPQ